MISKIKELISKYNEQILYLIFGVLTTVVSVASFYFFNHFLHFGWKLSNVISWIMAVSFAYFTNRKYVFESKEENLIKEVSSFFASRLATLGIDMLAMYIFIEIIKISNTKAKLIVQIIVIVLNYILSKVWVFKKK